MALQVGLDSLGHRIPYATFKSTSLLLRICRLFLIVIIEICMVYQHYVVNLLVKVPF
jgi:hypothetical protein